MFKKKKVLHDARLQPIKITNDFNKRDGDILDVALVGCQIAVKNRDCYTELFINLDGYFLVPKVVRE